MTTTVTTPDDLAATNARLDDLTKRVSVLEKSPVIPPIPPVTPTSVTNLSIYRRGRSGPLPTITKTPAQLIAAKLVLPYKTSVAINPDVLGTYTYKIGEYESLGLTPYIPGTGERQEIGLVTEAQAQWMTGASPNNMLAQAEAHGSIPIHFLADGKIVDAIKYPNATSYGVGKGDPNFVSDGTPVTPDQSHHPSLSYIPYLATGDQYYLEELQFAATYQIINSPPSYRGGAKPRANDIQIRGLAWGLREVAQAYIATPDVVTGILLPKSYWKQLVANHLEYLTQDWINSKVPLMQNARLRTLFSTEGTSVSTAPWQHEYLSEVIGWMIYTGQFPEWRKLYEFIVQGQIIRATGPLRSQACQYWLEPKDATDWPSLLKVNGITAATPDGLLNAAILKDLPITPATLRGALKLAVLNNVTGATDAFSYIDSEASRNAYIPMRWAV